MEGNEGRTTRTVYLPDVSIRANGSSGYIVEYRGLDGRPIQLREFVTSSDTSRENRKWTRACAQSYRDGVAEGIFRATHILPDLIGAGT